MGINTTKAPKHHYNYFLALERDLENLSRYVEFAEANLGTYSIELTHLLLSASSEVDVVLKQICEIIAPNTPHGNIDDYKAVIKAHIPALIAERIYINRFCLDFVPWENWNGNENPNWWRSYNKVKHERNNHFADANLKNTINAVGALLIVTIYYYKLMISKEEHYELDLMETNYRLAAKLGFISMNPLYYRESGWHMSPGA